MTRIIVSHLEILLSTVGLTLDDLTQDEYEAFEERHNRFNNDLLDIARQHEVTLFKLKRDYEERHISLREALQKSDQRMITAIRQRKAGQP